MDRRLEQTLRIVTRINLLVQVLAGALLVVLVDVTFLSGSSAYVGWARNPSWLRYAIPLGITLLWSGVALTVIRQWWQGRTEAKRKMRTGRCETRRSHEAPDDGAMCLVYTFRGV